MTKHLLLSLLILFCSLNVRAEKQDTLSVHASRLMFRLNKSVAGQITKEKKSPDYGAVWCPGCQLYHTRAAEALFPLAYEYQLTKNRERLRQAIGLGNWLIAQQKEQGQWLETPEEWTGTSTDQLLMMLLAYPIIEKHLSKEEKATWLRSMETAGDYLARVMDNGFASINYCATTTATLAELYQRIPKTTYIDKARALAHTTVSKMNAEYFIEGEGSREGQYKYGIDLGYNMEMSLWGLARYALLTNDRWVTDCVRQSLANHLWFIFPDGTLDGSSGIRSNKWVIYGSGTSDGCQPLFAMFAHENEAYRTAAIRNIHRMEHSFTKTGLLGTGPHYDRLHATPPCIYPTFTKAKSMAMAMSWITKDIGPSLPIPTDSIGHRYFPTTNTTVIRTENLCGTVTAYNYKAKEGPKSKYMHRPVGGALCALWVKGFGLLQAASQTEYHRWEPMSFPVMPEMHPLTPRIEVVVGDSLYTNLYEFDATMTVDGTKGDVNTTAHGQLKNRFQKPCGIAYTLTHRLENSRLTKQFEIRHETITDNVRLVEPVVLNEGTTLTQTSPRTIEILYPQGKIILTLQGEGATMKIDQSIADKYFNIFPALQCMPVIVEVEMNQTTRRQPVTLTYQLAL